MYRVFDLYKYIGAGKDYAPDGFKTSPSLETYLNFLQRKGYKLVQVVHAGDSLFYSIIVEERS